MATMIRKQVYLEPHQDEMLKRWAKETGQTEAEILRQALEHWIANEQRRRETEAAWSQVLTFAEDWAAQGDVAGKRTWTREDLYDRHTD